MDLLLLLAPVAITSAAAWLLGRRARPARTLPVALARLFECVGLTVVFLVLNTLAGALVTLLARALLGRFVSLYVVTGSTLLFVSALQAVALRWWLGERA